MAVGLVVVLSDVGRWCIACEATTGGRGRAARTHEWGRGGASGAAAANGGAPCARSALLRRRARGARRSRGYGARRGRDGEQRPQAGEAAPREGLDAGGPARRALLVQRVGGNEEEGEEGKGRREKKEREKGKKEKEREREIVREREGGWRDSRRRSAMRVLRRPARQRRSRAASVKSDAHAK